MGFTDVVSTNDGEVTCIACGTQLPRSEAREYDKLGDRWDRQEKQFEFMCKPCHGDVCHFPREGLEATLIDAGAGTVSRDAFLRRYFELAETDATRE